MKLDSFNGQISVTHAHDHAVVGFGGNLQNRGHSLSYRVQRVIPADLEFARQAFKNAYSAMRHERWFSVDRIVQYSEFSAEGFDDSLQTEADSKYRNTLSGGELYEIGNAKIGGPSRAR